MTAYRDESSPCRQAQLAVAGVVIIGMLVLMGIAVAVAFGGAA